MRYCISKNRKKYGRWEVWEYQRLKIEGNYLEGKKHGKWIWWDKNGTSYKTIEYEDGVEVHAHVE